MQGMLHVDGTIRCSCDSGSGGSSGSGVDVDSLLVSGPYIIQITPPIPIFSPIHIPVSLNMRRIDIKASLAFVHEMSV